MTPTTLVYGGNSTAREQAITARFDASYSTAVIAEGISGISGTDAPLQSLEAKQQLQVFRIAPGCPCCSGNLTMRVTLNRILRRPPQRLYLSLASAAHLPQIRNFLQEAQYQSLLSLSEELNCGV
jgi:G3E family GTPase